MKQKIRKNTFETNSSSVHSLTYSLNGLRSNKLKINENNKIEIDYGHFGSTYKLYNSQYDKLSYLITCFYYLCDYNTDSIYEDYRFKYLENIICEYTGASGIEILNTVTPYIDSESVPCGNISIIDIFNDKEVIHFIFNKDIALETTHD